MNIEAVSEEVDKKTLRSQIWALELMDYPGYKEGEPVLVQDIWWKLSCGSIVVSGKPSQGNVLCTPAKVTVSGFSQMLG